MSVTAVCVLYLLHHYVVNRTDFLHLDFFAEVMNYILQQSVARGFHCLYIGALRSKMRKYYVEHEFKWLRKVHFTNEERG